MGAILAFSQDRRTSRRRPLVADERRGEILFFTGVRYERHTDLVVATPKPQTPGSGRGRRRA